MINYLSVNLFNANQDIIGMVKSVTPSINLHNVPIKPIGMDFIVSVIQIFVLKEQSGMEIIV